MKVKDLINYLQKQNQEDFVGMEDLGSDTGDWFDIDDINTSNLKILSYDNVIKRIKKDNPNWYGEDDAKKFIAKYKEVPNLAIVKPVIYMRVSKKEMDENTQLPLLLKKYNLKKNNCIILQERKSGYDELVQEKRTALNNLIDLINTGEVKEIYIYSLERIYRNIYWLLEFYFKCQKLNVQIHSYLQPEISIVKGKTPTEKLMKLFPVLIAGYVAEQESYLISKRTQKSFIEQEDGSKLSYKGNKLGRKTDIGKLELEYIFAKFKNNKTLKQIKELIKSEFNKDISIGKLSELKNKK